MGFRSQNQKTWLFHGALKTGAVLIFIAGLTAVWQLHSATGPAAQNTIAGLELRTLKGERLRLQDEQGKPVLLSFWSTSCSICIQEMPEMNRLYHALDGEGATLISVTMPYDPPNHVFELAQALEIDFPVAIDLDAAISEAFAVPGTPYKVLLTEKGEIAKTFTGPLDYASTFNSVTSLLLKP